EPRLAHDFGTLPLQGRDVAVEGANGNAKLVGQDLAADRRAVLPEQLHQIKQACGAGHRLTFARRNGLVSSISPRLSVFVRSLIQGRESGAIAGLHLPIRAARKLLQMAERVDTANYGDANERAARLCRLSGLPLPCGAQGGTAAEQTI